MRRDWLPECSDLVARLADAASVEQAEERLKRLRTISNHDHDFPATMRLDRAILRAREALAGQQAAGFDPIRLALLSTSTTSHLPPAIRVAGLGRGLLIDVYEPSYGQGRQEIADPTSELHAFAPSAVLFANDAYGLFGVAGACPLDDGAQATQVVQLAIESLRGQWRRVRKLWDCAVIQQLPFNPVERVLGENEQRAPGSTFSMIRAFQHQLRVAAEEEGVDLLDLEHWALKAGLAAWHSPALWHRSKQEIHPTITPLWGDLVARLLAARTGRSAKCLVLDLDNTVWGGVIGDDGMDGIVIGQGSPIGEGFLAVQNYAKQLARKGVILAVCSKNDEDVAKRPFLDHPEMALRLEDISCFVANWTDKATNIRRIAKELNIGLDALVFADDNPFERELIRRELPEVFVPELPEDASDYPRTISDSGYFESASLTKEDLAKTEQYRSNAKREALREEVTDIQSYLAALDMTLKQKPFDQVGLSRIVQLINKTNQFNLTTRRYTEAEVAKLLTQENALTWQLRLVDRFGDNGVIGIVIGSLDAATQAFEIETWLMSCRVLGRQVEQATLNVIAAGVAARGGKTLVGEYLPSGRNGMVKDHYPKLGFSPRSDSKDPSCWILPLENFVPFATPIKIEAGT